MVEKRLLGRAGGTQNLDESKSFFYQLKFWLCVMPVKTWGVKFYVKTTRICPVITICLGLYAVLI